MTVSQVQAAAFDLRTALLDNGVRAVSIELQPGVSSSDWNLSPFKRGLGHHIVSSPAQGMNPGLAVVKKGRGGASPLQGPLANGYGGFDEVARIITMGWANHPGLGGPWSVPGWGVVPRDNGRPYIFGWEFEGGVVEWTDSMHEFMARCGAGTLDWLGSLPGNPGPAPLECWGEHSTWAPLRKIDRLHYTTASGRARIAAVRGRSRTTVQEDTNMAVIEPDGEAVIIKGVGHKRLRVACDFDPQSVRIAFNGGGTWGTFPGADDYVVWVAPRKVSYLDLPADTDFISVVHKGVGEGGSTARPVTVDTAP